MIIIGEKINSTLKAIRPAMEARDSAAIIDLAKRQTEAGASFIDVNAGMFHDNEIEILEWLINTIQEHVSTPFAIDSPNPLAIKAGLKANRNGKPIINSITGERERLEAILPLAVEYNTGIIALCMDDNGMPETADERIGIARTLIKELTAAGIAPEDIYIDPMIRPIGTGSHYGNVALDTMRAVKQEYPEAHIACGLSNISFGIPARKVMNQAFLVAAMTSGMDGAILDPLDKKLMTFLYATEALLGTDDFCMNYITKFREGELEV
ncbi:MAG: methyltetrahydrofolate cobalamin methyltransferase [Eubacteriales bacterium]|nr:methyltetrahydrofolate cobalamin methyltransferase [Eubacteriales bacterium]MDD4717517.1 methyltetrahydrofolate cobalamin methyltransferase [Eubacteriales bacterium]